MKAWGNDGRQGSLSNIQISSLDNERDEDSHVVHFATGIVNAVASRIALKR